MYQNQLLSELSETWLSGLSPDDYESGQKLLNQLVVDWLDEAQTSSTPEVVISILKDDLAFTLDQLEPLARLQVLRLSLIRRQVDHLSAQTYQLGQAVVDVRINDSTAREEGRIYLNQAELLSAELAILNLPGQIEPVQRELADAMLDALFAVEREAMSLRLSRYLEDQASIS
jgi:hypothetical protein